MWCCGVTAFLFSCAAADSILALQGAQAAELRGFRRQHVVRGVGQAAGDEGEGDDSWRRACALRGQPVLQGIPAGPAPLVPADRQEEDVRHYAGLALRQSPCKDEEEDDDEQEEDDDEEEDDEDEEEDDEVVEMARSKKRARGRLGRKGLRSRRASGGAHPSGGSFHPRP